MIFRYYPQIDFNIRFWNQSSWKKIPWHRKNSIFEARFSISNMYLTKVYHFPLQGEMAQWLRSTKSELGQRGFESSCGRYFFSSRTALTNTLSPISGSAAEFFVIKKFWHRKFHVTKNFFFELLNLKADFYNSTYTSNHAIFSKKKTCRTGYHCNSGFWECHKIYSNLL